MILAVDLDGTLAHFDYWRGVDHIGEPVRDMLTKVEEWHKAGHQVWIYTARLSDEHGDYKKCFTTIVAWCRKHLSFVPNCTGTKWGFFDYFFDDRACHVEKNTGKIIGLPEGL
jgi:hypothetical protein